MKVSKVKISNALIYFHILLILLPCISSANNVNPTVNGTKISIIDGYYEAVIFIEIQRDSDTFISAGKSNAQFKIIEDLLFHAIYNSSLLDDIESNAYKNILSRLAVDKLLNNKLVLKGLSEVEYSVDGSTLSLKMRIEKSKIDEAINRSLN